MASHVEMAEATLGHHKPGGTKSAKKPKPMKEFHVRELHDGSYHTEKHHGHDEMGMPVKPSETGSSPDLDGVHDALEEHFGGDGEKGGEKKQGHSEAAKHEHEKPEPEDEEKPEHGETEEK